MTVAKILPALSISICLLLSACQAGQVTTPQNAAPSPGLPAPVTNTNPPVVIETTLPPRLPTATYTPASDISPTRMPTAVSFPAITFNPGDFYFRMDGRPGFLFSRNIAGYQIKHYENFLEWTGSGGSRVARIQVDSLGMGYTGKGEIDRNWLMQWDLIFQKAEQEGLYVLPVFTGWFDWNAGSGYSTWKLNPLNQANGGPAKSPADLFQKDSRTQTLWLQWVQKLVEHWQGKKNILAWEIFSEVNLASGATEQLGIDFVNQAAAVIRSADPSHRPVTASLADTGLWHRFYKETAIDFINIHPYPPSGQLDRNIIKGVRRYLSEFNRPVLIGESGLSADTPDSAKGKLTVAENAPLGIEHAIWAGIVSGAMNGRALYWEDSFAIYFNNSNLNLPFVQKYAGADLAAARFVQGIDFSSMTPLTSSLSPDVWGAAIGNEQTVIGWFRDAGCEPPDWNLKEVISGQTITISVPGTMNHWKVDFYDTHTGIDKLTSTSITRLGQTVTVRLPDFKDAIAIKMTGSQ